MKENFHSIKRVNRYEYSDKFSRAERIIEEIFDEFWPDYQEENWISLETELAKADLDFESIFDSYYKDIFLE